MSRLNLVVPGLLALSSMMACGPVEIRVSKAEGVKPISGTLVARLDGSTKTFVCGDSIIGQDATQTYTVTTKAVTGGCEFAFDQEVEVLAQADYASIKEFTDAVKLVNRVELQVQRMDFFDDSGARFDIEARLRDMELWVNGQQILDVEQIRSLPRNVVLQGEALNAIKSAVKNRERCTAHVVARVVVLDSEVPSGVRCEYESQPTLILSSSEF
jgi:hypothetical protein